MSDVPRFTWTRHDDGSWSAHNYVIKRDRRDVPWRVLRDGSFWDAIDKLPDAKRACERDIARRRKRS